LFWQVAAAWRNKPHRLSQPARPGCRDNKHGQQAPAPSRQKLPWQPLQEWGTDCQVAAMSRKDTCCSAGENLFRISLNNGLKYKDVAAWNNLSDNNIKVGQVLRLTPPADNEASNPS
jgi:hypothetical protein